MGNLLLVKRRWPTRIAVILQALGMAAAITLILTILFVS